MRFTPDNITSLKPYEIFVFGSNEAGIHGAGAARVANKLFGAKIGVGVGRTGQTYAIPTKDHSIRTLDLDSIKKYVDEFIEEAHNFPYLTFLVTQIGCGLAGHSPKDIAPMFSNVPSNVIIPEEFYKINKKDIFF